MAVSAHAIARELRRRLPGVPTKKLHKLLYYCQGHHLAATGAVLFEESISAWDMGPVVGRLWYDERNSAPAAAVADLDEAQLNTVGYVVSRYGGLTGADLQHLTHAEDPWRRADMTRVPGESTRIEATWLSEWFAREGEDEDDELGLLDSEEVRAWLKGAASRRREDSKLDDLGELQARAARAG